MKHIVIGGFMLGLGGLGVVLNAASPGGFFAGMLIGAVLGATLADTLWPRLPAHCCRRCREPLGVRVENCPRCFTVDVDR